MFNPSKTFWYLGTAVAAMIATSAHAQTTEPEPEKAESYALDEILVTAQRRSERLQDVPVSVQSLSGESLTASGASSVVDLLQRAPGFTGYSIGVGGSRLFIRGAGTNDFSIGSDPTVAVFLDDVYIGRSGGAVVDLVDLDRVEILKGPQGTLFGRNTIGGAISLTSRKPDNDTAGEARLSYGTYSAIRAQGSINIPIVADKLALRVGGLISNRDGYRTSLSAAGGDVEGQNVKAIRATARWTPTSRFELLLSADWSKTVADSTAERLIRIEAPVGAALGLGALPLPAYQQVYVRLPDGSFGYERRPSWGASARADLEFDNMTLSSITAYRGYKLDTYQDQDATPFQIFNTTQIQKAETFSQEFRVASSDTSRLRYLLGVSAFVENVRDTTILDLGYAALAIVGAAGPLETSVGVPLNANLIVREPINTRGRNQSYAAFGNLGFEVIDGLTLTVGLRYTHDIKRFSIAVPGIPLGQFYPQLPLPPAVAATPISIAFAATAGPVVQSSKFNDVSPRFAIDYKITPDVLVYISATRGFKTGGFNATQTIGGRLVPFGSESVWSYEGGIKSELFDRRIRFNASVFHYDYTGLQVQQVTSSGIRIDNGGSRATGAEIDFAARPVPGLDLSGTVSLIDARYTRLNRSRNGFDTTATCPVFAADPTRCDFAGNRPIYAPGISFTLAAEYGFALSEALGASMRAEYNYLGKQYLDANNAPENTQSAYGLINLRAAITWRERIELAFVGRNLANQRYVLRSRGIAGDLGFIASYDGVPRTYGVEARVKF